MKGTSKPRHYLIVALLAALSAGCASTTNELTAAEVSEARFAAAPNWYAEPFSWDKLQHIENWLASSGPTYWPGSVAPAELELANGRLALARRDREKLTNGGLSTRLSLAEAGYRRVLADGRADAEDRASANTGLREAKSLRSGLAPNAPATAGAAGSPHAPAAGARLSIRPRAAWGARPPVTSKIRPSARPWTRITIHHSATDAAAGSACTEPASAQAIRLIQKDHMGTQGWGDIGYHFLIDAAGRVFQGRQLTFQGAHAGGTGGRNNVANIGICLLGDFHEARPDPRALRSLEQLVAALSERHGISRSALNAHKDFKATDCPGPHLMAWVRNHAR